MSKKGFRVSLQNMPSPNFTSFLAKQTMGGFQGGNPLAGLQNHYWMKHKKSTGQQPSGMEEASGEEPAAEVWEPSGEDGGFEAEAKPARVENPSREERMPREKKENSDGFTAGELQKAVAMSIVLGPPACRRRRKHEGITGRR